MNAKLRSLADYFLAARSAAAVNPRAVDPKLLPHIFILDVERDGDGPRLRIRMTGTEFGRVFGRPVDGHHLEEFLHGPRGTDVIAGFHECALTRAPVWMRQVVRLPDKAPRFVEGVAVYLEPARIYGGLVVGELSLGDRAMPFELERLLLPV